MEEFQCQAIFEWMLLACKISKFQEINFKILAQILATPKIIAKVKGADNLQWCIWCGEMASLEHILLNCCETKKVHSWVVEHFPLPKLLAKHWIYGLPDKQFNPVIWITNFTIYKCHILACQGTSVSPVTQLDSECARYSNIYPILCLF